MDTTFEIWTLLTLVERLLAVTAVIHAVMNKRETQSVIGWVGLIWFSPLIGSILYTCFGINRIRRQGQRIQRSRDRKFREQLKRGQFLETPTERKHLPFTGRLDSVVSHVTGKSLLSGNEVIPLQGGEQAYPAMLNAIAEARQTIALSTYIFDNDRAGKLFIAALAEAVARKVEVRVLIDDVGQRYSNPSILRALRQAGITAHVFLPTLAPRMATYANLRLHRKMMVVDGKIGFTGGMNIREGCRLDWNTKHPVQDLHFQIRGPAVWHIQEALVTDWAFASGETLFGEGWFAAPHHYGTVRMRGIPDGPDNEIDDIRLVILGALAVAEKRVDIVTPYFLPDESIINAMNIAAMKGIQVRVLLPAQNNIRLVQWAQSDPISNVLSRGCQVFETPPPFDHTKLMLVDNDWALIGSSNWDPRSLRLNFEFNMECYDHDLVSQLDVLVEQKLAQSKQLTLAALHSRPWLIRLRDGLARMGIPYL